MKEYSLDSLKNDSDAQDVVMGTVRGEDDLDNSAEKETPKHPSIRDGSPESPHKATGDNFLPNTPHFPNQKTGVEVNSDSADNSYSYDQSDKSDPFNFPVTAPPLVTTAAPWPTPTPNLTPQVTQNTSRYDSTTSITTSEGASPMPGGVIAGVVVGAACVIFVLAAFVTMKKRAVNDRFSESKLPSSFGDSQPVPLAASKLAPPGAFGKLNSGRNHRNELTMSSTGKLGELKMSRVGKLDELNMSRVGKLDELNMSRVGNHHDELNRSTIGQLNSYLNQKDESRMSSIFSFTHDDPFTRKHMRKGGIWDDPVIVAARIPLEKIRIQELIAKGGFGQVFLAAYNGQTVAVKTLLPETAKDMNEINALFAETKVMAKLEHPCIVSFIGIAWGSLSTICCVTEYLVGGDLRALLNHFLDNHTRPRGFDHDKVKIALDIADGLAHLHSMEPNILHRDLKSRNVLLTSQLNAKLTDFGVSRERSDDLMTNAVGTSLWMAPEVMMGGHYDGKADVYSFGVLLSELDTHFMPYANVRNPSGRRPTEAVILQRVAAGNLKVEFSRHCPMELLTLAHACISVDPKDRPTAADALHKLQIALESFEAEEVSL